MKIYRFLKRIALWLTRFFYRPVITGAEHEPDGAYLLCANHLAYSDVVLIGTAVRQQLHYMAKAELFSVPLLGSLIRRLGAFPVRRGTADLASLRTALAYLRNGQVVAVFPQGTRRPGVDARTTETLPGAAMLAFRAKVPVLPVYLDCPGVFRWHRHRNRIIIGKPISYEELGFTNGSKLEYASAMDRIFSTVCALGEAEHSNK